MSVHLPVHFMQLSNQIDPEDVGVRQAGAPNCQDTPVSRLALGMTAHLSLYSTLEDISRLGNN